MLTSTYPLDKATEVAKTYAKVSATPPPPFFKQIGSYGAADIECGIRGYTLFEFKDEKLAEALRELIKRLVPFGNIVGYRYKVEILMSAKEAMIMMGLTPP